MGLELHEDDVGWDLKHDIGDEEYHQGCVVFSSIHNPEILSHPEDGGVSDVDSDTLSILENGGCWVCMYLSRNVIRYIVTRHGSRRRSILINSLLSLM